MLFLVQFSDLNIMTAQDFIQEYLIDKITPNFIIFLTALAAVAVIRAFGRF